MSTISVITPTIGRPSLKVMLDGLLPQLEVGDEVLIVGDGPQPAAKQLVDSLRSPFIKYWEHGPIWNYGNPQRNLAISVAKGDYIMFLDDDDRIEPKAIDIIKKAISENPGRIFMFKMDHVGHLLWREPKVVSGNISGQMFVCPNLKGRIGTWSSRYAADFDFITGTIALYPEERNIIIWKEEKTTVQGLAGLHVKAWRTS